MRCCAHRDLVKVGARVQHPGPDDHIPVFAARDEVVLVVLGRRHPRYGLRCPASSADVDAPSEFDAGDLLPQCTRFDGSMRSVNQLHPRDENCGRQ